MDKLSRNSLPAALCASLLLHALILVLLPVHLGQDREPPPSRQALVVGLSILRPVLAELRTSTDPQNNMQESAGLDSQDQVSPQPSPPAGENSTFLDIPAELASPRAPEIRLPTPQSLRDAVRDALPGAHTASAPVICTDQQRRSQMFDCPSPEAGSNGQRDAVPRSRRPVALTFSDIEALSENLRESGLASSEATRQVNLLKAASADLARTGNAKLNALRDEMFRNDATWQIKKRVLEPR
jgi:hypothetical protein